MRPRILTPLAVAVVVLVVVATAVVVTHHGSLLGLGRQSGAAVAPTPPVATEPATPPPGALVARVPGAASRAPLKTRTSSSDVGQAAATTARSSGNVYPGSVACPSATAPSPNSYAFECTHSDGSPVRWSTGTIKVWAEDLTPAQRDALSGAETEWTAHTGITLVPAPSAAAAQLVLTEVPTLDALPGLGADVVEYAVTDVHQTGGYYDRAVVHVANVAVLDAATWLDTMLHELGHVAGLAHVTSPDEIMRPVVGAPQTSYGDGDVTGLESERPR